MKYYQEITLLAGVDIAFNFLWEKVYMQIHLGFVELQDSTGKVPIGIGFPGYLSDYMPLGRKLRLFAHSRDNLENLDADSRLRRLADYIHLTKIRNIPSNINNFNRFKRQHVKTNKERLARRRAKRQKISIEQALAEFDGFEDKMVGTPFINIKSLSTSKRFRLFIQKQVSNDAKYEGFSTYGLSDVSTVPEF